MKRTFTAAEKTKALKRELELRRRVYPRNVQAHRMTQEEADYQIAIMEAIITESEAARDKLNWASGFLRGLAQRLEGAPGWDATKAVADCRRAADTIFPPEEMTDA